MSFSAEWLALREPVDHRSRNAGLANAVRAHFAGRGDLRIVDFGCGTGSNLRATHALLPAVQHWTLVDYDAGLLAAARTALRGWADSADWSDDQLHLTKSGRSLHVGFRRIDLNADLDRALEPRPDLVTASALFDLISEGWIRSFAAKLAAQRCAFYTVLTYDGRDDFLPQHPADRAVVAAFAAHQAGDKGFGPAAGPRGADALASALSDAGFAVQEADSPWRLGAADSVLAQALIGGIAQAVRETEKLPPTVLADWAAFRQANLTVAESLVLTGHRDTFAVAR